MYHLRGATFWHHSSPTTLPFVRLRLLSSNIWYCQNSPSFVGHRQLAPLPRPPTGAGRGHNASGRAAAPLWAAATNGDQRGGDETGGNCWASVGDVGFVIDGFRRYKIWNNMNMYLMYICMCNIYIYLQRYCFDWLLLLLYNYCLLNMWLCLDKTTQYCCPCARKICWRLGGVDCRWKFTQAYTSTIFWTLRLSVAPSCRLSQTIGHWNCKSFIKMHRRYQLMRSPLPCWNGWKNS